ncbi:hypothetical protein [Novipirellula artificiosorum]|uniref:TNFR-Cys domain-containing protein n=1 Tax=Novipirellula artificiosorum TaxID=2528016 RepID=A0A5C6D748_9BACT|nr:hypothetical protein [Novipirellula artificiosorum]TWU33023.1 hypothetical protein Poly41_54020 [Novipirellula artificiosorum]
MSLLRKLSIILVSVSLLGAAGCVGPMACGPMGCESGGACGPIAWGAACGGCGECEGCGELYVDPWINEPADCCDPCDQCGNYNGQSCGKCRSVFSGIESLWGYRCGNDCSCSDMACGGSCGGCGGCDSCGSGETYISGETYMSGVPTPAGDPIVEGNVVEPPYQPARQRQIFRPKPQVAGRTTSKAY